jgi:hypothetical protein
VTPIRRIDLLVDEETLERLKGLARERGVSFTEIAHEALEAKAAEYRSQRAGAA